MMRLHTRYGCISIVDHAVDRFVQRVGYHTTREIADAVIACRMQSMPPPWASHGAYTFESSAGWLIGSRFCMPLRAADARSAHLGVDLVAVTCLVRKRIVKADRRMMRDAAREELWS